MSDDLCLRSEPITNLDNEGDAEAFEVIVGTLKKCFKCQEMSCLIKKEIVKLVQQHLENN